MELFTHDMDLALFRSTNEVWNQLGLNAKWSVGTVTEIIQQRSFVTKEEWQQYYYESGRERLRLIQSLPSEDRELLLRRKAPRFIKEELRFLNTHYGRTPEELDEKGRLLYESMVQKDPTITLELCQSAVHYRVIGETWNGVMVREQRTISNLMKQVREWGVDHGEWRKTPGDFDYQYEVDYELFLNQQRVVGLQIKPDSYRGFTPYLEQAKRINLYKNEQYYAAFQTPVLYVYANSKGQITNNSEVQSVLKRLIVA